MTKEEYKKDFWIGFGIFLFAVLYIVLSQTQIGDEADGYDNVTSRTFPYIIGGILLVVSIASMIINHIRSLSTISNRTNTIDTERVKRACFYAFAIALYTISISCIGYVVSTFAVLVFAMWFSGARINATFIIVSIVLPPVLYYVFHVIMEIPLPVAWLV